jgi:uncharacterized membrane protein YbhN (UPF0104 family)
MKSLASNVANPIPRRRWRRLIMGAFSAAIFIVAARMLILEFSALSWDQVVGKILLWRERSLWAVILCGLSFLTVGVIEWRALRWAGARIPFGPALSVSFIANGFAHSLGATALVAGAIRARMYARHHVDVATAAAATTYQLATSASGFAAIFGIAALRGQGMSGGPARYLGIASLLVLIAYIGACALVHGSVRLFGHRYALPSLKDAVAQLGLGIVDNALALSIFWVLIPPRTITYASFAVDYVLAYVGGALSGVPGGIGTFETVLARTITGVSHEDLAAAFLGFRLVFYVLPLLIAGLLYLLELARERRQSPSVECSPGSAQAQFQAQPNP